MSREGLRDHCLELLAGAGQASARRMFGGHGLYLDGVFIGIIAYDRLFLKADEQTRARFEAEGCVPFEYAKQGATTVVTALWSAPEEAMDSPALMMPWARMALQAALRARAARSTKLTKRKARSPASSPGAATAASDAARPKAPSPRKR